MQVLNLVRPEKSDIKFEIITFPDGEPHIKLEGKVSLLSVRTMMKCISLTHTKTGINQIYLIM